MEKNTHFCKNTHLFGKLKFQVFGKVPLPLPKSCTVNLKFGKTAYVHVSPITIKLKVLFAFHFH